ncbi:MAG: hypothetical protein AABW46_02500 [Nanoarchaeota archaeon]
MKRGILVLLFLILNMALVLSVDIPDECIVESSSDINLDLKDGPKVLLQKYSNIQGDEEVIMYFYDENILEKDDIGALKLILNYKKIDEGVFSFFAIGLNECNKDDVGCQEYFIKKIIPESCRRIKIEELVQLRPPEVIVEEEIEDLRFFDSCSDLPQEITSCPKNVFIRGANSLFLYIKYNLQAFFDSSVEVPSFEELNDCKRINIVITGEGFNSNEEKEEFVNLAKKAIRDGIFRNEVMLSNVYKFNIYLLDPDKNLGCEPGYSGIERALYCDLGKIKKAVTECPNDFVLVLVNSEKDGASYVSNIAMSTSGAFDVEVIEHELIGHAVGDLRDEYWDDSYYGVRDILPERNCYVSSSCIPWCDGNECLDDTGCYNGCMRSNWYRPHSNSFMRSVGKEIGSYNERLICERIKDLTGKSSRYCDKYE